MREGRRVLLTVGGGPTQVQGSAGGGWWENLAPFPSGFPTEEFANVLSIRGSMCEWDLTTCGIYLCTDGHITTDTCTGYKAEATQVMCTQSYQ